MLRPPLAILPKRLSAKQSLEPLEENVHRFKRNNKNCAFDRSGQVISSWSGNFSQVVVLFSTLELSVYRVADRQKLFALRLPLASTFATKMFPICVSRALVFGTSKVNLLLLDLERPRLDDFVVPFANTKILKIQQILTKENNFVFLNDYNQILFCKFICQNPDPSLKPIPVNSPETDQIPSQPTQTLRKPPKIQKMVIDLVLKFNDERERVLDFTINSLGNIILVLFASGQTRFLDVDILKQNYDHKMPEYLISGEGMQVSKLPCDDLARTSGIVQDASFKKVSKFKIEYFHKARDLIQKDSLAKNSNENRNPNKLKIANQLAHLSKEKNNTKTNSGLGKSLFDWKPVARLNGLHSSLCNESSPPKFGLVKLKNFLRKYGAFPDDMRLAIWGYLVDIPLKKNAFDQLKFLGEYTQENSHSLDSEVQKKTESLKTEILNWKSKWNLKTGYPLLV